MLAASDLAYMRARVLELLPDTCNILSVSLASDGQGGQVETWGTATAGIACRVDYKTGQETNTAGEITPYQSAVISLPYDAVITSLNRVEFGALVFSVQADNNGQSWQAVTRVTAELVP